MPLLLTGPALAAPIAVSPKGYITDPSPLFQWQGEATAVKYHLIFTVTASNELIYENKEIVGTEVRLPASVQLQYGVKYTWKVRSVFADGSSSALSNFWDIMLYDPGFIPQPEFPAAYVPTNRPVFKWSSVTGGVAYELELIERDTNLMVYKISAVANVSLTLPETINLDREKVYHWRVRAFNSSGGVSKWSDWLSFLCYENNFAATPQYPYGEVATIRPVFLWSAVANTLAYEVEVRNTAGQIVYQGSSNIPSLNLVSTSKFNEGMTYEWRVRAINTRLQVSAWSQPLSFQVLSTSLVIQGQSPVGTVNSANPTLVWSVVENAVAYAVEILDTNGGGVFSGQVSTSSLELPPDKALKNNTNYRWRVRAIFNGDGFPRPWSPTIDFAVAIDVSVLMPSNFRADLIAGPEVLTQWDAVSGIDHYVVSAIKTAKSAPTVVNSLTPLLQIDVSKWTPGNYSFSVIGIDNRGVQTKPSGSVKLTVK